MKRLILVFIVSLTFFNANATHIMGGEITWQCIKDHLDPDLGKYIFTMKLYRDCEGISAPSYHSLNYSSSCGSSSINLYQVGQAVDINAACVSYCNGGTGLGIEQYTYEGTITLSNALIGFYQFVKLLVMALLAQ